MIQNSEIKNRIPQWQKEGYKSRNACMGDKTQSPEAGLLGGLIGGLAGGPVGWSALGGAGIDYWINGRGGCDQKVCP